LKNQKIISTVVVFITLVIISFQTFQNLGANEIKLWDEARGANNAIEMSENGDYIVVRFDGLPDYWNSKPPLAIWLKVISYKIFGINEFAVRFPTALFVLFTTFLMLLFSYKYFNEIWSGVIAVLIMVNSTGYMGYHVGRNGEPDVILVFFILFYALFWFVLLEKYPKRKNIYYLLFGLGVILAVYTKNIAGLAPLLGIFIYTIYRFKLFLKIIKDFRFYLIILLIVSFISAYFVLREQYNPGYTGIVIKTEITGMFIDYICGNPKHPEFTFYINYLYSSAFKYYFLLLPLGFFTIFFSKNNINKRFIIFNYIMILALILGYSSSEAKNEWYIAPVFPFMAFTIGLSLYEIIIAIAHKVKQKNIKFIAISIIVTLIGLLIFKRAEVVYKKNLPSEYVYNLEAPGIYLKKIKNKYRDIKKITIATNFYQVPERPDLDQIKFYAKKYKIEDNIDVINLKGINDSLSGKYVLTCDKELSKEIQLKYSYKIIESDKNAVLYKIKKLKSEQIYKYSLYYGKGRAQELIKNKLIKLNVPDTTDINNIIGIVMKTNIDEGIMWLNDFNGYLFDIKENKFESFKYRLSEQISPDDIVSIAFDTEKDETYTLLKNGIVYIGKSFDLSMYKYVFNEMSVNNDDVKTIGIAIENKPNNNDLFFRWYNDNKFIKEGLNYYINSNQTDINLKEYILPIGFSEENIIDIAVGGTDGYVYTFIKE